LVLTKTDISTYKLPPAPAKSSDSRNETFVAKHGNILVELDGFTTKCLG